MAIDEDPAAAGIQASFPDHVPMRERFWQYFPVKPVGHVQLPLMHVPPYWQEIPTHGPLVHDTYSTAQNRPRVSNAVNRICLNDLICCMWLITRNLSKIKI